MTADASLLSLACLMLILLIPLAIAGIALVNVGLGRSHSAAHAMLGCLCALSVATVTYLFLGSRVHLELGGIIALAANAVAPEGAPHTQVLPSTLAALFQVFAVSLVTAIPLSAGTDRWRLGATCFSTAILAGLVYPLFSRWTSAAGWLGQLGLQHGLGSGFLDTGGAGAIHTVAGLSALVVTLLLGPRRAKYASDNATAAIPGHNIVLVFSGCLIMTPGWMGLNAAGALLSGSVGLPGIPLLALNTLLAAAGSSLAALALTRIRFGKPDASLSANGWVAGLVAGSAACSSLTPLAALFTGAVVGILILYTIELLELRLRIDDPGGAISVHAVAGMWGLFSLGLFTRNTLPGQLLAQTIGIATLLGCILPLLYLLNAAANRLYHYRIDADGERQGMDLRELGAGAYPEFVVHRDEFSQR